MQRSRPFRANRVMSVLAAVVLCLAAPLAVAYGAKSADLIGDWKLTKVLDSSEITSIDDQEAARLVGKTFTVQRHKISLDGQSCDDPEFERHREKAARYIREQAHAPVGRLGLSETITVVDLACAHAILKSQDKIVVYWKGYFFDATKLRRLREPFAR